jgi:hypothetical protein
MQKVLMSSMTMLFFGKRSGMFNFLSFMTFSLIDCKILVLVVVSDSVPDVDPGDP